MYVTQEDLKPIMRDDFKNPLLDNSDAVFIQAANTAMAEVKSYIGARYNVALEYSKTGSNRNAMLVQCICYLTRYILLQRLPKMAIGANNPAATDRKEMIEWLRRVSDGNATIDIEPLAPNDTSTGAFLFGSEEQRSLDMRL